MNFLRIQDNILIDPVTGCWNWQKSCSSSGYGQLTEDKVYWNTHVYVWTLFNSRPVKGRVVRHSCHNKKCCNIDHLEEGTYQENWYDFADVFAKANAKRRKTWEILGVSYKTSREAVKATRISISSVIKYTENGIFDHPAYLAGCRQDKRKE